MFPATTTRVYLAPGVTDMRNSIGERHIRAWRESGLSQAEYCRLHHLKPHQMIYWRVRMPDESSTLSPTADHSLVEVFPHQSSKQFGSDDQPSAALHLLVGDRFRVEVQNGFDPATLRQLIFTLETL
jgi:hypothetical protein